jgi:predicted esterase
MNRRNLIWVFLVFLFFPMHARAGDKLSREAINTQNKKRYYYLFVPESVKAATSVPLIVLFHGSGHDGTSLIEKWEGLARREGLILAGPNSYNPQVWAIPEDGPEFIHDMVEAVRTQYPIDPRRVYLFGHSGGAVFAITLAMQESEYFAAVAVHAGAWRNQGEASLIDYAKRKIPLAMIVGDMDPFFPLASVKATEAALKARGFPAELTVMKGHDHWYYDLAPEINRIAWDFLKRYELTEAPKYVAYSRGGGDSNQANEVNAVAQQMNAIRLRMKDNEAELQSNPNDVNIVVQQINALRMKANEAMLQFNAKEEALRGKDYRKERELVAPRVREEIELLAIGAGSFEQAALLAEQASHRIFKGTYRQYFSLLAQLQHKRAEALNALKERAELLLSDGRIYTVTQKMNEAAAKAERLNKEAEALEQNAERLRSSPAR